MIEQKSFLIHEEWVQAMENFPPELQLELYQAIMAYGFTGEIPELSPTAKIAFSFIQVKMDKNKQQYKEKCDKLRDNAKKGKSKQKEQKQANATKSEQMLPKATKSPIDNELYDNSNELSCITKKRDVITSPKKDELSAEINLQKYADEIMQVENQNWREVMSKKFKIEDFARATEDYRDWLIGTTFCFQANSLEDYKRIFCYNANKFLSDDALKRKPTQPIVINGVEYS